MKTKTSELTGRNLNWAVAIALGWKWKVDNDGKIVLARPAKNIHSKKAFDTLGLAYFQPINSWSTAGPIIERERITIEWLRWDDKDSALGVWGAQKLEKAHTYREGFSPLIAAMRCFVASVLGDEVDIPEELK